MRHRKGGAKLGRTTAHRASTLRHIAYGLFEHGQVVTTMPKAKAVQPMVEKNTNTLHIERAGGGNRAPGYG